jgi:hypothetical protein
MRKPCIVGLLILCKNQQGKIQPVSLASTHRLNKMYSSPTMVEARAPEKKPDAISLLKKVQNDEKTALGQKHHAEFNILLDKQHEARNNDIVTRNGGGVHRQTVADEDGEKDKLNAKHDRQRRDMRERHRVAMERALKEHGVAP